MLESDLLHTLLRAQFGITVSFHFLFVPLSIGLLLCMNLMQTAFVFNKQPALELAARLWGRFFLLVWATGILTGYPLRWQLEELWTRYLEQANPVLGAIFSIEGQIAPFMIGCVLLISWARRRLPAWVIMVVGWALLALMVLQALTILSVNAWMQNPYVLDFQAGSWLVTSASQLLTHPTTLHKVLHTMAAASLCGAFFLLGVAAYWLRQGRHPHITGPSLQVGAWVGLIAVIAGIWSGHASTVGVAQAQPMKFAVMEGHWQSGQQAAPLVLFAVPDEACGCNRHELTIPYLMSLLSTGTMTSPPGILDLTKASQERLNTFQTQSSHATGAPVSLALSTPGLDATLTLTDEPRQMGWLRLKQAVAARHTANWSDLSHSEQNALVAQAARPPVVTVFVAFRIMVLVSLLCLVLCVCVFIQRHRLVLGYPATLLTVMVWSTPLPWLAILSGWMVAEVGRQPWTIHEYLPTLHASHLPGADVSATMLVVSVLAMLLVATVFLQACRSIFAAGPDQDHWLDLPPWWQHVSRAGGLRQALSPARVQPPDAGAPGELRHD